MTSGMEFEATLAAFALNVLESMEANTGLRDDCVQMCREIENAASICGLAHLRAGRPVRDQKVVDYHERVRSAHYEAFKKAHGEVKS